ncbi:MAG: hypothetical protein RLY93_12560 [Sumerlaeia bacterium]
MLALLSLLVSPACAGSADIATSRPITLAFHDAPATVVLTALGYGFRERIVAEGEVTAARVSLRATSSTLENALSEIAAKNEWVWFRRDGGDFVLCDHAFYDREMLGDRPRPMVLQLEHRPASELIPLIAPHLSRAHGRIVVDEEGNRLLIYDERRVLQRLKPVVEALDLAVEEDVGEAAAAPS